MKIKLLIRTIALLIFIGSYTLLIGQSKEQTRAQEGEKVMILTSVIKEGAKEEYEKFMQEFFDILLHDKSPLLQEQYLKSRWLKPASQNADKTWTYAWILDPYVEDGDYFLQPLFERKVGKEAAEKMMEKYNSFFYEPQKNFFLIQSEH